MIVYQNTKQCFMKDIDSDRIADIIEESIFNTLHRRVTKNEFHAFDNSLPYMYRVLNDDTIPIDSGIAIEYNVPQTSKRVDFMISGYGNDERENVVIVELKQWESLDKIDGHDALVETYTGNALRQVVHPSYQAWSYAQMIKDYNSTVQNNNIELHPCACLHNYLRKENDPLDDEIYKDYLNDAPAFTKGDLFKLRSFIQKFIKKGDRNKILYEIDNGKIKPSKSLQDTISSMVKGNKEFIMLDDQKVVYEKILNLSIQCQNDFKKRTIIVEGGPGTGKTVVAINLLAELTNRDQLVQYVSKNATPRNVYTKKLKQVFKKNSIDNMFKGSGSYTEINSNMINTLLCDEAHRLNEKSGMFQNLGENQIKEIINASYCSVFFIDESQRVTIKDIGSIDTISEYARELGSELFNLKLESQFRCNGSDGYISWLDNILEIKETANYDLNEIDYDFKVFDDPNELRSAIVQKNKINNKSRLVAGYCWNWVTKKNNEPGLFDITIPEYGFKMKWNFNNTSTWAIDDDSINQCGCIHTCQGLEFDYVGVIIGDDITFDGTHIVTDYTKRAKTDQSLKGIKGLAKKDKAKATEISDEIIKNTYRTLMTRGMKGCYIYCTDKRLYDYLKSFSK